LDMTTELTEFNKLKIRAQKRAIEDKLTQYYKKMIDEGQYQVFSPTASLILPTLHELKEQTENIYDVKNGKNEYCFFTINFKSEYDKDILGIEQLMNEFVSTQKYIRDKYMYVIEQRNDKDILEMKPTGVHVHILFPKGENSPSKIKRAFQNKFFDKYVGSPACIDYRFISTYIDKIRYMMGMKKPEKMTKVYHDRYYRENIKWSMWYNVGWDEEIKKEEDTQEYKDTWVQYEHFLSLIK